MSQIALGPKHVKSYFIRVLFVWALAVGCKHDHWQAGLADRGRSAGPELVRRAENLLKTTAQAFKRPIEFLILNSAPRSCRR